MPLRNLPVPLRRSLAWIVGMSAGHGRLSTAALLGAVSRSMTPAEDSQNKLECSLESAQVRRGSS
jgi:hypothetical protein